MADASHIEVLKPGLATSVQDKGRQGYYHLGIPPSGALDQYALAAANLLVGNAEDAAVLECTLLGPELLFHRAALIAVTGATMAPKIDGKPMPCNMALAVPAGSRLSFEFVSAGARACLAVAGGIDVPVVLGSRSTYTLGAIGGHEGRRLKAGDKLAIGQPSPRARGANCPWTWRRTVPRRRRCAYCRACTTIGWNRNRPPRSTRTPGPSRPRPTASATARAARCVFASANSPSARARIRPTSSTPAIPSARSRCRPAWSPSSCTATRCPAAATP